MLWGIGLLVMALLLLWASFRLRARTGVPEGAITYSDAGAWQRNPRALVSHEHGLKGKPDYLVETSAGVIPVELKSGPAPREGRPREGHVLQALAYCVLVEAELGRRPPHAIIKYDDRQFEVAFSAQAEAGLLRTLEEMHAHGDEDPGRSHASPARCASCGVRTRCDEAL